MTEQIFKPPISGNHTFTTRCQCGKSLTIASVMYDPEYVKGLEAETAKLKADVIALLKHAMKKHEYCHMVEEMLERMNEETS